MMTKWVLVAVMVGAMGAFAQDNGVDAEAYRAAMERLKAKAASQPSELDRLRQENTALRREVAELKTKVRELLARVDVKPEPVKPDAKKLKLGMSLDEVRQTLGGEGTLLSESENSQTYRFVLPDPMFVGVQGQNLMRTGMKPREQVIIVNFSDGKATAISYR